MLLWRADVRWLAVLLPALALSLILGVLVDKNGVAWRSGDRLAHRLGLLPASPLHLFHIELTPDRAFPLGLGLSLIANATIVVATAMIGLRATGRRSIGLIAASLCDLSALGRSRRRRPGLGERTVARRRRPPSLRRARLDSACGRRSRYSPAPAAVHDVGRPGGGPTARILDGGQADERPSRSCTGRCRSVWVRGSPRRGLSARRHGVVADRGRILVEGLRRWLGRAGPRPRRALPAALQSLQTPERRRSSRCGCCFCSFRSRRSAS